MMLESLLIGCLGTVVLWMISAALAMVFALGLATGAASHATAVQATVQAIINLTRGIPTSILVLAAGIGTMSLGPKLALPIVFPGTAAAFQPLAWAVVLALAFGSAGHLAEILLAVRASLGYARLEQMRALGLSPLQRLLLIARETAEVALPPVGARLVHHLHNTAFAALFPVTELFGMVQGQANLTFQVLQFALLGCAIYLALSSLIWLLAKQGEIRLRRHPQTRTCRPGVAL